MPVFEIEEGGRRYQVEAASLEEASKPIGSEYLPPKKAGGGRPIGGIAPAIASLAQRLNQSRLPRVARELWEDPGPGLIGSFITGTRQPGRALRGEFNVQTETPGVLTEEDVERQRMATEALTKAGAQTAAAVTTGAVPATAGFGPAGPVLTAGPRMRGSIYDLISRLGRREQPQQEPLPFDLSTSKGERAYEFLSAKGERAIDSGTKIKPEEIEAIRTEYGDAPTRWFVRRYAEAIEGVTVRRPRTPRPSAGASQPPKPPTTPPPSAAAAEPGQPFSFGPEQPSELMQEAVNRAKPLGIDIPRFIAGTRTAQGLAEGVKNLPGAGNKIAAAAERTRQQIGEAVKGAERGFGTGSPEVAGSVAREGLADWIGPGSRGIAQRFYDRVDALVNPDVRTTLDNTRQAAERIITRRKNAMIPGQSGAVNLVNDAIRSPTGLNYQGLKDLRTQLLDMSDEEIISQGLNSAEVKQLIPALTSDLRNGIRNAGGDRAVQAFDRANALYRQISERRQNLVRIIGVRSDAAPVAVTSRLLAMASSRARADIGTLREARRAMGPDAWNEVASSAIAQLGRDAHGEFSLAKFLTGWHNLSDEGRNLLFKSTGREEHGKALDDIAFITRQIDGALSQYAKNPGTARSWWATAMVLGYILHPVALLTVVGTRFGASKLADVLSEPVAARATAEWLKEYREAITAPHANSSKKMQDAARRLADVIAPQLGANPAALGAQLATATAATPPPEGWRSPLE